MARLPRLSVPDFPHHIIQRGNNRQPIFAAVADYLYMWKLLEDSTIRFDVAIHAYVLMENHFHLLASPRTDKGLSQMMQAVGRSYVRYYNDLHGRSGTLWEGRYRSTIIQPDLYLLPCMAYIDLNPVRGGLVAEAKDFPWSSHGHYAGLRTDRLITPHPLYWSLGNTPFSREAAYAEMVRVGVSAGQQAALTGAALSGWVLGGPEFVADLQKQTDRRVQKGHAGRPALNKKNSQVD